jgi:hypothetical protein
MPIGRIHSLSRRAAAGFFSFIFNGMMIDRNESIGCETLFSAVSQGIPLRGEIFALLNMSRPMHVYCLLGGGIFRKTEIN